MKKLCATLQALMAGRWEHILPPCGICREFMRSIDDANLNALVVTGWERSVPLSQLFPLHEWPQAEELGPS